MSNPAGGLSCEYRDDGTLWVSRHRDDELELDHLCQIQEERGLPAKRLTGRETRAIEPYLSPRIIGGLLVESDHQVNSRKLVAALEAACVRVGVEIITKDRALPALSASADGWRSHFGGRSKRSLLHADQVLLAAGSGWRMGW